MESGFIIAKSHIFIIAIDVIMPMCLIGIEWPYYFNVANLKLKWRKLSVCYISLNPWYYTVIVQQGTVGSKKAIELVCFHLKIWNKFIV